MKTYLHVSMGISNICCFANVEAQCYPFLKHYPQHTILLGHSMMECPPKRFLLKLPLHPFWFGSHRLGFSGFQTSLQKGREANGQGKARKLFKIQFLIGYYRELYYLILPGLMGISKLKTTASHKFRLRNVHRIDYRCASGWLGGFLRNAGWSGFYFPCNLAIFHLKMSDINGKPSTSSIPTKKL